LGGFCRWRGAFEMGPKITISELIIENDIALSLGDYLTPRDAHHFNRRQIG
jgi:hypothetical protein